MAKVEAVIIDLPKVPLTLMNYDAKVVFAVGIVFGREAVEFPHRLKHGPPVVWVENHEAARGDDMTVNEGSAEGVIEGAQGVSAVEPVLAASSVSARMSAKRIDLSPA